MSAEAKDHFKLQLPYSLTLRVPVKLLLQEQSFFSPHQRAPLNLESYWGEVYVKPHWSFWSLEEFSIDCRNSKHWYIGVIWSWRVTETKRCKCNTSGKCDPAPDHLLRKGNKVKRNDFPWQRFWEVENVWTYWCVKGVINARTLANILYRHK